MATRIILGEYQKPFGEYKNMKLDFQILVASAKQGSLSYFHRSFLLSSLNYTLVNDFR
jgi:hypothetical protein